MNKRTTKLSPRLTPQTNEGREMEKLTKELKKHEDNMKSLQISCDEVEKELLMVKGNIRDNEEEYGSIWKERYECQVGINSQLEAQLANYSRQLQQIKNANKSSAAASKKTSTNAEDEMSQFELQKLLEHLKKKKAELEWTIRDNEWRLDREGKILDQTEEGLKELQTRLNETNIKIIESHHKKQLQLPVLTSYTGNTSSTSSEVGDTTIDGCDEEL